MKKYVALSLLTISSIGLILNHVTFERMDNKVLVNVDGVRWDALGQMHEIKNQLTRQCSKVSSVSLAGSEAQSVQNVISEHSPPDSRQLKLGQLLSQQNWYLAEVGFEKLDPAVLLLEKKSGYFVVHDSALWSGPVGPWRPSDWIHQYLQAQAPSAPSDLIACYEPTPGLFQVQ